jgi:hypothetical protein
MAFGRAGNQPLPGLHPVKNYLHNPTYLSWKKLTYLYLPLLLFYICYKTLLSFPPWDDSRGELAFFFHEPLPPL